MNFDEKINQLKSLIELTLNEHIQNDYVLLDLPYHANIGDTLIWEGEYNYLSKLDFNCLYSSSSETCSFPPLKPDTLILIHGGGNFGDLYPEHLKFLKKIIKKYPNNKILVFPQTVYYENVQNLINDSEELSCHNDLSICVRDNNSFLLLTEYLNAAIVLLPDMAFCISNDIVSNLDSIDSESNLYIKRVDSEFNLNYNQIIKGDFVVSDWPTFSNKLNDGIFIAKVISKLSKLKLPLVGKWFDELWDYYALNVYKNDLLKIGVDFIKPYRKVYSTRLHGCILAILMNREVVLLDNSYGKNSNFYYTWLSDLDGVKLNK